MMDYNDLHEISSRQEDPGMILYFVTLATRSSPPLLFSTMVHYYIVSSLVDSITIGLTTLLTCVIPVPGNPARKPDLRNGRRREWLSYLPLAKVDGIASVAPASIALASIAPALPLPLRHQQLNTGVPRRKKAYVNPYMIFLSLMMLVPASYPSCSCMLIFIRSSLSLTM